MLKGKSVTFDLSDLLKDLIVENSSSESKQRLFSKNKNSFFKRLILLSFLFLITSLQSNGQVSGDYGAVSSGAWSTPGIWKIYNGVSWASSPVAGAQPNSSAVNVWIVTGSTVTYPNSLIACNNITVMSTAKLYSNTGVSNKYLYVYGNITCDGTIGNGAIFDDISLSIESANCLFTGAGVVDVSRIRKNTSTNIVTNFTININITIRFGTGSQTQLYNATGGTDFNVTVNAGKIVSLSGSGANIGNVCIDGLDGSNGTNCGGTFTINGTLIVSGILYLTTDNTARPCTWNIGPTGIVTTAAVIGSNSGSATHTLNMAAGSLLQISLSGSSAAQFLFLTNNNYNLTAGSTIEYNGGAAQYVESSITYANLKISNTSTKTAIGVLNIAGNLDIITPVGTVLAPYPADPRIFIGGNWTDYGSTGFLETPSTVIFNGSGNQTITCAGGEIYYNIQMNKSAGQVILASAINNPTQVINNADFISGVILACPLLAANSYYLKILNTATVTNASNASYVDGTVGREAITGSPITNFVFPVGKSGWYRPDAITGTPAADHTLLSDFLLADPITAYGAAMAGTLNHVSRCEYWRMRRVNVSGSTPAVYTVTLSWPTYLNCMIINALPDLRVTSWASPTAALWNDLGNGGTTGTTAAGTVVTASTFSYTTGVVTPFTLSSIQPTNPLPVELLSFTAKPKENEVDLDWSTATEINNDYFTIERSSDGKTFEDLMKVDGFGTTSQSQSYSTIDHHPLKGISYYRLRQTDFDGKNSVTDPIVVRFDSDYTGLTVYPNPATNSIRLLTPKSREEKCTIQIISIEGRVVKSIIVSSNDDIEVEVDDLPKGVYNVELNTGITNYHSLFVKQ